MKLPKSLEFPGKAREVYEPGEDSFLLLRAIRERDERGSLACDMGTGSGIIAEELAKRFGRVLAVDINKSALAREFPRNVVAVESDLFSKVSKGEKFDLICFNAPYLPGDEDARWSCGDGTMLVEFLEEGRLRLSEKGKIIFLISSLTPEKVIRRARDLYSVEILGEERLPGFETLFALGLFPKAL